VPDSVFANLRALVAACDALANKTAAEAGLTRSTRRALEEAVRCPGITPSELAERLGVSSGAMTDILNRLEALFFVVRERGADRRYRHVTATEAGVEVERGLWAPGAAALGLLLAAYTSEELRLVNGFLADALAVMRRERG
jgi:DNA-binding MarR family transcriptional regulator